LDDDNTSIEDDLEYNTLNDTVRAKKKSKDITENPVTREGVREDLLADIVGKNSPEDRTVEDSSLDSKQNISIVDLIKNSQATVDGMGNDSVTNPPVPDDKSLVCWGCEKKYDITKGALHVTPKKMIMSYCPYCGRTRLLYRLDKAPPDIKKLFKAEEIAEAIKVTKVEEEDKITNLPPEIVFKSAQAQTELPLLDEPETEVNPKNVESIKTFLEKNRGSNASIKKSTQVPDSEIDMSDEIQFTDDEIAAMQNVNKLREKFVETKKEFQQLKRKDEVGSREEPGMPNRVKGILDNLGLKTMMDEMLAMQAMEAYGDMAKGFFGKFNKGQNYQQQRGGGMDIDEIAKLMIMKQMFKEEVPRTPQPAQQNDSLVQMLILQQFMGGGKSDGTSGMLPILMELIKKQQQPQGQSTPAPDITPIILEVVRSLKETKSNPDDFVKMLTAIQALNPKESPPPPPQDSTEQFIKMLTTIQAMNPKKEVSSTEELVKLMVALKEASPPPQPHKDNSDDMLKMLIALQTMNKPPPQQPQPTVTDLLNTVTKIVETSKPPPQQGLDPTAQMLLKLLEVEKTNSKNTEVPMLMNFFDKIQAKDAEIRKAHDVMLYEKLGELAEAAGSRGGDFEDEFKKITMNYLMNKLNDDKGGSSSSGGIGQEITGMLNGPFGKVLGRVAEAALQNKQNTGSFYVPPDQVQGIQQDIMSQFQGGPREPQVDVGIPPEYAHLMQQQQPPQAPPQGFVPQNAQHVHNNGNGNGSGPRIVRGVGKNRRELEGTDITIVPGTPTQDTEITRDGANSSASPSKGRFWQL